jgi:hypothetical protein
MAAIFDSAGMLEHAFGSGFPLRASIGMILIRVCELA